jgi:hypothetical protein
MDDRAQVRALLGREPQGRFEVVLRDADQHPIVVRNDPLLDDGTPMPTRYWLVGRDEVREVSRLEAAGGVAAAEAELDPAAIADAHARYAAERDAALPPDHSGPRPSGGVGGTRTGVKCLHAHYAWHLAGGDDPVGRWVAERLATATGEDAGSGPVSIDLAPCEVTVCVPGGWTASLPVGPDALVRDELAGADPPAPQQLTNALGAVTDHLDDVLRDRPDLLDATDVRFRGAEAAHLARVELGRDVPDPVHALPREAAEELFRTLATERTADRLHNPGLVPERVETVVATCCIVLAVMRRLHLAVVTLETGTGRR